MIENNIKTKISFKQRVGYDGKEFKQMISVELKKYQLDDLNKYLKEKIEKDKNFLTGLKKEEKDKLKFVLFYNYLPTPVVEFFVKFFNIKNPRLKLDYNTVIYIVQNNQKELFGLNDLINSVKEIEEKNKDWLFEVSQDSVNSERFILISNQSCFPSKIKNLVKTTMFGNKTDREQFDKTFKVSSSKTNKSVFYLERS